MAMPSVKRFMQMTHQPQQCNWRMNMMGCGGENDARLCQRLDDVKKLTPDGGVGEEKNRRSERRKTAPRSSETDATRSL